MRGRPRVLTGVPDRVKSLVLEGGSAIVIMELGRVADLLADMSDLINKLVLLNYAAHD